METLISYSTTYRDHEGLGFFAQKSQHKENKGRTMMQALELLRLTKKHVSGQSVKKSGQ